MFSIVYSSSSSVERGEGLKGLSSSQMSHLFFYLKYAISYKTITRDCVLFKDKCLEEPQGEGMCLLVVMLEHECWGTLALILLHSVTCSEYTHTSEKHWYLPSPCLEALHIKHGAFSSSPAIQGSPNNQLTLLIWPVRLLHLHLLWWSSVCLCSAFSLPGIDVRVVMSLSVGK